MSTLYLVGTFVLGSNSYDLRSSVVIFLSVLALPRLPSEPISVMSVAKRARVERVVKTVIFVIDHTPYKATLNLPKKIHFSIKEVADAVALHPGCKELIPLPAGYFEVLHYVSDGSIEIQVALFRFRDAVGCRKTESPQHSNIHKPIVRHRDLQSLIKKENNIRVGSHFVFGFDQQYSVNENGSIIVSQPHPPNIQIEECRPENERTYDMMVGLKAALGEDYIVSSYTGDTRVHYCPFSGGGDISIFKRGSSSVSVVMTEFTDSDSDALVVTPPHRGMQSDRSEGQATPPKDGEYGCVSVENKVTPAQCEWEVTLQLQANMLVLCSGLLRQKFKECPSDAEKINNLCCYGLQLGLPYPLKVLKLTVDFESGQVIYEELLNACASFYYPVYIDMCLFHLVNNL